jgi:hypothetical protein
VHPAAVADLAHLADAMREGKVVPASSNRTSLGIKVEHGDRSSETALCGAPADPVRPNVFSSAVPVLAAEYAGDFDSHHAEVS